jgi:hypothetical protein
MDGAHLRIADSPMAGAAGDGLADRVRNNVGSMRGRRSFFPAALRDSPVLRGRRAAGPSTWPAAVHRRRGSTLAGAGRRRLKSAFAALCGLNPDIVPSRKSATSNRPVPEFVWTRMAPLAEQTRRVYRIEPHPRGSGPSAGSRPRAGRRGRVAIAAFSRDTQRARLGR